MMPTITVRVSDQEKADVERRAGGAGLVSAFVRRALDLERDAPDLTARVDDLDRRLTAVEQMAGLE